MQTLGPFTAPALGVQDERQISQASGLVVGVEIANLSGNLLRIDIGSRQEFLPAYRVDRFPMLDETTVHVTNVAVEIPNTTENIYTIVAAYVNDAPTYLAAFPGSYPSDVVRAVGVQINAGSVAITGTANVSITNTPSVIISGTPNVAISGTPTVILGAGTASVGSISAISSTVTVAGTINIGNTPAVTISGTPTVNIGNTPSVTISGNITIGVTPGPADVVGAIGALNALNATATVIVAGLSGASMTLAAGTLIGTIVPEVSFDGGTSWAATLFFDPVTQSTAASIVFAVANTLTLRSIQLPSGASNARVRVSAYTSGTANCTLRATSGGVATVIIGGNSATIGTVILGAGTASVGSITAISSTVTVAGTINIGNTPAVTISGTPSVTIASGTVSITGTPSINITSQSVTLGVNSPQISEGTLVVAANSTNNADFSVPAGTHSIGIAIENAAVCSRLIVKGVQTGTVYLSLPPAGSTQNFLQGYFVAPVVSAVDTQVNVQATSVGGATLAVVAILNPEAQFVFNNINQPLAMELVGVQGYPLGDTSATILNADRVIETASGAPGGEGGVLVSLKPTPGLQIAQVGVKGAFTTGTNTQVIPPFGQATTAGHFLVAWITGQAQPTTVSAGWVKILDGNSSLFNSIWVKPNCGAGEAAPTFTCVGGTSPMYGQIVEFSGVAFVNYTDQTFFQPSIVQNPIFVFMNAPDAGFGDLVVANLSWFYSVAVAATFSDVYNNGATAVHLGDSGPTVLARHTSFSYAIIPTATKSLPLGIDVWPYEVMASNGSGTSGITASIVLAAVPGKAYHCHSYTCEFVGGGTAYNSQSFQLLDGASQLAFHTIGVQAVASYQAPSVSRTGVGYVGTPGNTMTLKNTLTGANNFSSVNIGGYIR